MTQRKKKKQTPTQKIKNWIRDFVTKPNPVFGDLPPCPFAQKAILDDKVEFVELTATADWKTIYQLIWNTDFDDRDVLCIIADPRQFTAQQAVGIAEELNHRFMPRDVVILEDHPDIDERVQHVKLNRFSKMLETGPYYRNWSKSYLEEVKGFRARKNH